MKSTHTLTFEELGISEPDLKDLLPWVLSDDVEIRATWEAGDPETNCPGAWYVHDWEITMRFDLPEEHETRADRIVQAAIDKWAETADPPDDDGDDDEA